jgi:hypothetical protein
MKTKAKHTHLLDPSGHHTICYQLWLENLSLRTKQWTKVPGYEQFAKLIVSKHPTCKLCQRAVAKAA